MLSKDERTGRIDQAKGHVKQAIGGVMGNEKLEAEGKADETVGAIEEAVGRASRKTGEALAAAARAVKP